MRKITAILILIGLVVLPMVAAADDSAPAQPDARVHPPGGQGTGCAEVQELIAAGTLPPDTPAINACESHGGGGGHRK